MPVAIGFTVETDGKLPSGETLQEAIEKIDAIGDAPLPGHTVAVLNPHLELVEDLIVCRDGHANQKPLYIQLLDQVRRGQCWIGDPQRAAATDFAALARQRGYDVTIDRDHTDVDSSMAHSKFQLLILRRRPT